MLVLAKQAFVGREEIRLPYNSLRERLPESPVPTCRLKNRSILLRLLIISLYYFQNYLNSS